MDNTNNFAALRAATLGAQQIQAPQDNPLGATNAPEVAAAYQSSFQLPQATQAAGAAGNVAGDIVAQQKAAAAAAAKHAADLANINSYKIVKKDDGGYDFFGPDGQQVDIATLSKNTGINPSDIVKDSQNPVDIQYVEDYNNLQDYIKAQLSGNKKKVQAYEAAQPELSKYQGKGGAHQLIQDFQTHYQRYYVPRSVNPAAWGITPGDNPVVPAYNTSASTDTSLAPGQ